VPLRRGIFSCRSTIELNATIVTFPDANTPFTSLASLGAVTVRLSTAICQLKSFRFPAAVTGSERRSDPEERFLEQQQKETAPGVLDYRHDFQ
jgi:hypothetical protein